jgi:nucleotide-binding universal stress UspA family protein
MRVLLATDGTDQSDAALEALKGVNLNDGDEVEIISVIESLYPSVVDIYAGYLPDGAELEEKERAAAQGFLQEAAKKVKAFLGDGVTISVEALAGSPESAIVERAEKIDADLIVVGSHGYRAWERLLIGSVSDSVVHHAPCSVLVVRPKKN